MVCDARLAQPRRQEMAGSGSGRISGEPRRLPPVREAENYGKQKVPTLRNVDKRPDPAFVKAYMHNGYFKTLKGVVHFYNTRDVKPACKNPFTREADAIAQNCWPEAQIKTNVNKKELGDLGLTDAEENAIVKFMQTLSDGFEPPAGTKRLTPGLR